MTAADKGHTSDKKKALWSYFDYFLVNLKKNLTPYIGNILKYTHNNTLIVI